MQYNSRVVNEELSNNPEDWNYFKLVYYFANPEYTKVFKEYVIVTEMGLIGNVGGTLGMCIGFSFSGLIALIISFFKSNN